MSIKNPEDSCPICGHYVSGASKKASKYFSHKCPKANLSAINGAHTRAMRETQNTDFHRTFPFRLAEGLEMINMDEN
jgi:hypothetical protein